MKSNRYGDFKLGYIDFLSATLGVLIVLGMIASALISVTKKEKEGLRKNADYVITVEWPTDIDCDVDLWVRDPQNNVVSYRQMEGGLMYFERDDMGKRRSLYLIDDKEIIIDPDNKEFVTLRGVFPGEYVVNIHVYSCIGDLTGHLGHLGMAEGSSVKIPLIVEVIRINPNYIVVKHIEMEANAVWEEKTAVRFVMNDNKGISRFIADGFVSVRSNEKKVP